MKSDRASARRSRDVVLQDYGDRAIVGVATLGCASRLKGAMIVLQYVEEKFQIAPVLAAAEFSVQTGEALRDCAFVNSLFAQRGRKPDISASRASVVGPIFSSGAIF
jgi:hypothetical protein